MNFETSITKQSAVFPEVKYTIRRISFHGRLQLTRMIGELLGRLQFHAAGTSIEDRAAASQVAGEIDRLYLEWGLLSIAGLTIDGGPCEPDAVIERGPEELCAEVVAAIKRECTLSADERKN